MSELNLSLNKYNNKAGYFCLANINAGSWQQNFFNCNELEQADNFIRANALLDSYNSIATFNTTKRTRANIELLTEHYIDIDNHLSPLSKEQAQEFLNEVLLPLFDISMPIPSQVVYSGRGLQLHFNLEGADDLIKWEYTQQALLERVQAICYSQNALLNAYGLEIDKSCKDSARVLRTIGTRNSKSNTYTELLFSDEKAIYTQDEIIGNYNLDFTMPRGRYAGTKVKLNEYKGLNKHQVLKATQRQLKEFKTYSRLYSRETLNQARQQDLFKIIALRNLKCINEGYRNNLLSIAVQLLRENTNDINYLINELLEVNSWFNEPLKEQEVISWCYSAVGKQLHFSNKYIINKLNITQDEQKQLITIISREVKNNRYYIKNADYLKAKQQERYKPIKFINSVNKTTLKAKARQLKEQGLKNKEIALKLNVSDRTIRRYLNNK